MHLVDTNVWLERLLDQERSEEVGRFLDQILTIISFDSDFDRTEEGRKAPKEILAG